MDPSPSFTAFAGDRLIASGPLPATLLAAQARLAEQPNTALLIFDDASGKQVDFDLRGGPQDLLDRLPLHPLFAAEAAARSGPGRPKLGVVSREVTLLPRHWDWLERQPQGASAALRRLVEEARKREPGKEKAAQAREAVGRLMSALAGDRPGYEEASRCLYAKDQPSFEKRIQGWPKDVKAYLLRLARAAAQWDGGPA